MDQIAKLQAKGEDSIERRQAGAITQGKLLTDEKAQLQTKLDALNQEIDVQQHRVTVEQKIFGLSSDLATLHKLDTQLQNAAVIINCPSTHRFML